MTVIPYSHTKMLLITLFSDFLESHLISVCQYIIDALSGFEGLSAPNYLQAAK